MNITDAIRQHASDKPDAPAVVRLGDHVVGYRDLDRTIDALARRAQALGLRPGHVAVIAFADDFAAPYAFLVLALALARIGVTTAGSLRPPEKVDIWFDGGMSPPRPRIRSVAIEPGWFETPPPSADAEPVPSHQEEGAILRIFTSSGTTGRPKLVALTHEMMARRIAAKQKARQLPPELRILSMVGPGTTYWFRDMLLALALGGLQVYARGAPATLRAIDRHGVNLLVAAPASLGALVTTLPEDAVPPRSLLMVEAGGSLVPRRLSDLARSRLCPTLLVSYGGTECGTVASALSDQLMDRPGAVGFVEPGVEVQAVDEDDRPLPAGTEGILRIRSDLCVDGYYDHDAAATMSFRHGWFYPGDRGIVAPDGLMSVTGRSSEVINYGGVKISPGMIDEFLQSLPNVREAAAFGVPNDLGLVELVAAIVPSGRIDAEALLAECREKLKSMAPRHLIELAGLPRNDTGKVLRAELAAMVAAQRAAARTEEAQRVPR